MKNTVKIEITREQAEFLKSIIEQFETDHSDECNIQNLVCDITSYIFEGYRESDLIQKISEIYGGTVTYENDIDESLLEDLPLFVSNIASFYKFCKDSRRMWLGKPVTIEKIYNECVSYTKSVIEMLIKHVKSIDKEERDIVLKYGYTCITGSGGIFVTGTLFRNDDHDTYEMSINIYFTVGFDNLEITDDEVSDLDYKITNIIEGA